MRGNEFDEVMAVAVDHLVNARESGSALHRATETIVGTIGWFSGKGVTRYLGAYQAKMMMRDIPKDR